MQAKYELRHAREILEPCIRIAENFEAPAPYDCLKLNECGVWPVMEHDPKFSHDSDFERWRYALELQHLPDAQEPDATPMLPNPFTGRELAAFMLEGAGALVRLEYGEWASGPNADRLSVISRGSNARRAVTEAFDAYRNAVAEVGSRDEAAWARREAAHKAYQNSPQDKALSKAFDNAEAEWQAAYKAWLTAMVCELLEPRTQAKPAKNGAATKWTPERINEVATYRKSHTEAQTAEKFGVSGALIRRKLAEKKSATKPKVTPFSGLVHRSK